MTFTTFPELKVKLFKYHVLSQKHKDTQSRVRVTQKQQVLTFWKLELVNVWYSFPDKWTITNW